jgi:hypothetical protein
MLAARKASEDGQRFRVVYREDGSVVEIRGLAEQLKAARMRNEAGEISAPPPVIMGGQNRSGGRWEECLEERMRRGRERVARAQAQDSTPLGSQQSRAAARAELERRGAGRRRIEIICSISRPDGNGISIGAWKEGADGSLLRISNIPAGMTIDEAERIVSQQGWKPNAGSARQRDGAEKLCVPNCVPRSALL